MNVKGLIDKLNKLVEDNPKVATYPVYFSDEYGIVELLHGPVGIAVDRQTVVGETNLVLIS